LSVIPSLLSVLLLFPYLLPPPPRSTLFPYTTLFRSKMGVPPVSAVGHYSILVFLGFFLMALMHSGPLRRRCAEIGRRVFAPVRLDRKSTRLNSSHVSISYAVFCLKKKKHK